MNGAVVGVALVVVTVLGGTIAASCGGSPTSPEQAELCSGYSAWASSAYTLPYLPGSSYRVAQANCSPPGEGHRGSERYAYDFEMPIGTSFVAIRAGVVVQREVAHFDGEVARTGLDNYLVVRHDDGTFALYGHLTHDGSATAIGDRLTQGQPIGRSGNTGNTSNFPHLHVGIHACDPVSGGSMGCPTLPLTFRNTEANPSGLQRNRFYEALP